MANKHEKMLTIFVIRELQIKTARCHYTPIRMAKNSHTLLVGMQNVTVTLEDWLAVSYKRKTKPCTVII